MKKEGNNATEEGSPRGRWDAFAIYCQREDLSHKEAITQMIEKYVDRKYLDFAYNATDGSDSGQR